MVEPLASVDSLHRRVMAARLDLDLRPVRVAGAAMLALGVALAHLPGQPGQPGLACPLRSVTGVPCPFCGLTTSVTAVLHGDGHAAWSANPFGLVAVGFAIALALRPHWRRARLPTVLLLVGVAVSWLFELHRYHFL